MRLWGGRHEIRHHRPAHSFGPAGDRLYLGDGTVGASYTMVAFEGGQAFREKLYSMGLNPGVKVKILINTGHGPVEIEARQTKLAIGRGMAGRIIIRGNGSS